MWESIHKHNSASAAQQLAQMREELASIGEKERVLRERSADREVYRYLLEAHRLIARTSFLEQQVLNISPPAAGEGSQLAA
ncbi:hypothetical protein CWO91_02515 [Bradyrhizobium genosp. SA-3]|uniref:hypothetical protein n=1 Tax=Bradyrhizobium genosp. SA-3 TaxID=508868 RepID=UPI00102A7BA5|nr:hypothetical protein [Bradyrhizobium genosp. SA-3]RZN12776.1 hypothetical protein CWO91_02515 [Bradyrhizobium genosp. SA-3]